MTEIPEHLGERARRRAEDLTEPSRTPFVTEFGIQAQIKYDPERDVYHYRILMEGEQISTSPKGAMSRANIEQWALDRLERVKEAYARGEFDWVTVEPEDE